MLKAKPNRKMNKEPKTLLPHLLEQFCLLKYETDLKGRLKNTLSPHADLCQS